MDMPSKDHVNFVFDEPALKHRSHALTLHIVSSVTVVEWNVHEHNEPRSLLPINPLQLFLKPHVLRRVFYCESHRIPHKKVLNVLKTPNTRQQNVAVDKYT